MHFNNQNRPKTAVYGCSSTTLTIGLIIIALMISGGLFLFFRNIRLILALGIIIWVARSLIRKNQKNRTTSKKNKSNKWSRDYEDNKNTSYDNIEREFEEIDDE